MKKNSYPFQNIIVIATLIFARIVKKVNSLAKMNKKKIHLLKVF
jgi:hypothetical protein